MECFGCSAHAVLSYTTRTTRTKHNSTKDMIMFIHIHNTQHHQCQHERHHHQRQHKDQPCDVTIVQFIIARFSPSRAPPAPPPCKTSRVRKVRRAVQRTLLSICDRPRLRALIPSRPHGQRQTTIHRGAGHFMHCETRSTTWPQPHLVGLARESACHECET